jgi:hypothetical protein
MPHLHLPIDHTEADLVLAANLAEIVGSEDLYVAWSHEAGAGAIPEVEAVVRTERELSPFGGFMAGVIGFWRSFFARPVRGTVEASPAADEPRRPASRPYAD